MKIRFSLENELLLGKPIEVHDVVILPIFRWMFI